jgi:hypothetical protein
MILDQESGMNVRRFRALFESGASYARSPLRAVWIGFCEEVSAAASGAPPPRVTSRKGTRPRVIEPLAGVVDAMLRRDIHLKASVIQVVADRKTTPATAGLRQVDRRGGGRAGGDCAVRRRVSG